MLYIYNDKTIVPNTLTEKRRKKIVKIKKFFSKMASITRDSNGFENVDEFWDASGILYYTVTVISKLISFLSLQ